MRLIFAGSPVLAIPSLKQLITAGHEIVAVLTQPDSPQGRKRVMTPTPVATFAEEHAIPVMKTKRVEEAHLDQFRSFGPLDLGVVVAYGALFPQEALILPRHGWINLHFSALPQWRGAAPAQWTVFTGAEEAATTVFQLVPQLDAGPVFAIESSLLGQDETSGDLLERLSQSGAMQLTRVVDAIASGAKPVGQQGEESIARKLTMEDAHLTGSEPGAHAYRRFLAVTPEPGAWFTLRNQRIKVTGASLSAVVDIEPGRLVAIDQNVYLGTMSSALLLTQVIPAGKSSMSAADWWRGLSVTSDTRVD